MTVSRNPAAVTIQSGSTFADPLHREINGRSYTFGAHAPTGFNAAVMAELELGRDFIAAIAAGDAALAANRAANFAASVKRMPNSSSTEGGAA